MISIGPSPMVRTPSETKSELEDHEHAPTPHGSLAATAPLSSLIVSANKHKHPASQSLLRTLHCPEQNIWIQYNKIPMNFGAHSELFAGKWFDANQSRDVVIKRLSFLPVKITGESEQSFSIRKFLADKRTQRGHASPPILPYLTSLSQVETEILAQGLSQSQLQPLLSCATSRHIHNQSYWSKCYVIYPLMAADFLEAITTLDRDEMPWMAAHHAKCTTTLDRQESPSQASISQAPLRAALTTLLIHQISQQLFHLHQQHYTHNDIKAENILCGWNKNEPTFALADFGQASRNPSPQHAEKIRQDFQHVFDMACMTLVPLTRGHLNDAGVRGKIWRTIEQTREYKPLMPLLLALQQNVPSPYPLAPLHAPLPNSLLDAHGHQQVSGFLSQLGCQQKAHQQCWQRLLSP